MKPEHRLLRIFARASRPLPAWMRTRRAGLVAGFGVAAFIASLIADFAGLVDVFIPDKETVSPDELGEGFKNLKQWMLVKLGPPGAPVAAPVETEIDKALSFYQSLKDPRVEDAMGLMQNASPQRALRMFNQVTLDYASEKNPVDAAKAWSAYGALALPVDKVVALEAFERARAFNNDAAYTHFQLGSLYQDFARLDEAKTSNDRAIAVAKKQGDLTTAAIAQMHNGLIFKQRLMLNEAEAALRTAVDEFQTLGDKYNLAAAYLNLGVLYSIMPGYDARAAFDANLPEQYFNAALNIGFDLRDPGLVANGNAGLAGIWRRRKNYFLAIELYARALGYFEWTGQLEREGQIRLTLGFIALELDNVERAKADFSTAMQIFSELRQPLQIAVARTRFAFAYAYENDGARACREITQARQTFSDAGMTSLQDVDALVDAFCQPRGPADLPLGELVRVGLREMNNPAFAPQPFDPQNPAPVFALTRPNQKDSKTFPSGADIIFDDGGPD